MTEYYKISISNNLFNELLTAIETAVYHTDGFDEVYELIHLYDYLSDEMEDSIAEDNEQTKRYLEQQKLFIDNKCDNIFEFHKIKAVLEDYDLDLDAETEFHLICDLSDVLNKGDLEK